MASKLTEAGTAATETDHHGDTTNTGNTTHNTNTYSPRRSQRVASDLAPSDGDIWQERLSVCEGVTPNGEPQLLIRSYYRNARTAERVWDEPPSGAGTVLHADGNMRRKAETEKQELELTLEMIPPEQDFSNTKDEESKVVKKGFFRRFQKKKKEQKQIETAKDLNLQRAIAQSMQDQHRNDFLDPMVYFDGDDRGKPPGGGTATEDEDLELAKALSMSMTMETNVGPTEEEMLQRAMEKSSRNAASEHSNGVAAGVASLPDPMMDQSYSSMGDSFVAQNFSIAESSTSTQNNDLDKKPSAFKFDPYAK